MNSPKNPRSPEFTGATPLAKFHQFLIEKDKLYFGLLGEDGKNNYFSASPATMKEIATEFLCLASAGQNHNFDNPTNIIELRFDTHTVITATPKGNGFNGSIEFRFITPGGMAFSTLIGPRLSAEMASSLQHVLATLANPPKINETELFRSKLPGVEHQGKDTEVHFGQRYKTDILNVLGLLVIRANLLELSMVRLLATLVDISIEKAEAIFYSSQNMKARSDMLRATASTAGLTDDLLKSTLKVIEKIDRISRRRNQLVHGEWSFSGEKFSVRERRPLANITANEKIETFKSIEAIVTDFHDTTVMLDLSIMEIKNSRNIA